MRCVGVGIACLLGACTGLNPAYYESVTQEGDAASEDEAEVSTASDGATTGSSQGDVTATSGSDSTPPEDDGSTGDPELDGSTGEEPDSESSSSSSEEDDAPPPPPPHVVYVNGEGPTMFVGDDDAINNTWFLGGGSLLPFQTPEQLPAVVEGLEEAFAGLNVVFVLERPMNGDYTMAIVTPTNLMGGFSLGVGLLDCGNENPNSVVAAFTDDAYTPDSIATVLARELGYGYGLDRVSNDADFMRASSSGFGEEFTDGCVGLADVAVCAYETCAGGQVNTFGELELALGPA
ncbi:MAG: hypothetical protein AAGA54_33660 [Myxococcota bacterium]